MTVEEMLIGVNIGVQKIDSNAYDNILTEEALYYLNKANREYIRRQNVYLQKSLKSISREDFISDNEANFNIGSLLKTKFYSNVDITISNNYSNVKLASLSDITDDVFDIVYAQARTADGSDWVACKRINPSEIHIYSETASNKPIFRRFPITIIGDDLHIFHTSQTDVYSLSLVYIKSPDKLVIANAGDGEVTTPELPVHTHDEIINIAVGMILEDIKSVRPYEQNQTTIKGE